MFRLRGSVVFRGKRARITNRARHVERAISVVFGLAPDAAQILKNSISTSHAYVQHNFIHNIAMESDVAHHCVTLGGHHVLWILVL